MKNYLLLLWGFFALVVYSCIKGNSGRDANLPIRAQVVSAHNGIGIPHARVSLMNFEHSSSFSTSTGALVRNLVCDQEGYFTTPEGIDWQYIEADAHLHLSADFPSLSPKRLRKNPEIRLSAEVPVEVIVKDDINKNEHSSVRLGILFIGQPMIEVNHSEGFPDRILKGKLVANAAYSLTIHYNPDSDNHSIETRIIEVLPENDVIIEISY